MSEKPENQVQQSTTQQSNQSSEAPAQQTQTSSNSIISEASQSSDATKTQETKTDAPKSEDNKTQTSTTDNAQKTAAPVEEEYELELPETSPLSEQEFNEIVETAEKYGLTKEAAQKLIALKESTYKSAEEKFKTEYNNKYAALREQIQKDPDFSGEKKIESFASINRALNKFGDDDLKKLLTSPEVGNHLALARFLKRIGDQIAPDTVPTKGNPLASKEQQNDALRKAYPEFFKNT